MIEKTCFVFISSFMLLNPLNNPFNQPKTQLVLTSQSSTNAGWQNINIKLRNVNNWSPVPPQKIILVELQKHSNTK